MKNPNRRSPLNNSIDIYILTFFFSGIHILTKIGFSGNRNTYTHDFFVWFVIQLKSVRGSFDIPENPNTLPNTKHLLIEFEFGSWEKIQSTWVLNWNLGEPKLQLYVTIKCSAYDVSCIGPNPQLVRETNFICTSLIRPMFQTCGSHTCETHMTWVSWD